MFAKMSEIGLLQRLVRGQEPLDYRVVVEATRQAMGGSSAMMQKNFFENLQEVCMLSMAPHPFNANITEKILKTALTKITKAATTPGPIADNASVDPEVMRYVAQCFLFPTFERVGLLMGSSSAPHVSTTSTHLRRGPSRYALSELSVRDSPLSASGDFVAAVTLTLQTQQGTARVLLLRQQEEQREDLAAQLELFTDYVRAILHLDAQQQHKAKATFKRWWASRPKKAKGSEKRPRASLLDEPTLILENPPPLFGGDNNNHSSCPLVRAVPLLAQMSSEEWSVLIGSVMVPLLRNRTGGDIGTLPCPPLSLTAPPGGSTHLRPTAWPSMDIIPAENIARSAAHTKAIHSSPPILTSVRRGRTPSSSMPFLMEEKREVFERGVTTHRRQQSIVSREWDWGALDLQNEITRFQRGLEKLAQ